MEMTAGQIDATVARFAETARRAETAGFDGVEVHAAHGYLISQYLSPLANQRTDQWGGSLQNRARLLLDVVRAVRGSVTAEFAVAVKLNSADFQRGGFDVDEAQAVIEMLRPLGVDLVELSGGSYESPAMTGSSIDVRTRTREAYFLDLAEQLATTSSLPLMLTGGIVRRSVAEGVLASGIDLVGMGSALAIDPDLPQKWRASANPTVTLAPVRIKDKTIASAAGMARIRQQLRRLGVGRPPRPQASPKLALVKEIVLNRRALNRYSRWLQTRTASLGSAGGPPPR